MRFLFICLTIAGTFAHADHPGRVCELSLGKPLVITDATFRGYWGRASQIPEPHRAFVLDLVARTLGAAVLPVEHLDIIRFESEDYLLRGRSVRFSLRLRFGGEQEILVETKHLYAPSVIKSRLVDEGSLLERSASLMLIDILRHAELFRTPEAMHEELRALDRWLAHGGQDAIKISSEVRARVQALVRQISQTIPGEAAAARRGAEFSAYLYAKQELANAAPSLAARLLDGPVGR